MLIHRLRFVFFIFLSIASAYPLKSKAQRFISLENNHRFKRIRIETGVNCRMRAKGETKIFRGTITRITRDSVYFGHWGVAVDSVTRVLLPPGKNLKYWITFLSAGVPGVFFITFVAWVNAVSIIRSDPKMAIMPLALGVSGLALLYAIYKMTFNSKKIGNHWKLVVLDLPLAP